MSIKELKQTFNPNNISPVNKKNFSKTTGPVVIATEEGIPFIHPTSLLPFDNIIIEGDSDIGARTIIRRKSQIDNAKLGNGVVIMDYITINKGSEISPFVLFAHGSEIGKNVKAKTGSFGNLAVKIGDNAVLSEDTYIGVKVSVPAGIETPPNIFAAQNPPRALSNAKLSDEWALKPHKRNAKYVNARLFDIYDTDLRPKGFEEAPASELAPYVLTVGPRFNLPLNRRTDHIEELGRRATFADLGKLPHYLSWKEQALNIEAKEGTTYANWLDNFGPTMHQERQLHHNLHDAKQFGAIVWNNASRQSEILALDRARKILPDSQLSRDIGQLIKAELYLLGAYKIKKGEYSGINEAYIDKTKILKNVSEALISYAAQNTNAVIKSYPQETIKSIQFPEGKIHLHNERKDIEITSSQIKKLAKHLSKYATLLHPEKESKTPIFKQEKNDVAIPEQDIAYAWKRSVNPHDVNILNVNGASRIQRYKNLVPVIADRAILINSDVLGGVVIKGILVNSTARNEQAVTPILIEEEAVLYNAGVHTAFREQTPGIIGKRSLLDGRKSNMTWVHGADLGPGSYVAKGAVVGDETRLPDGAIIAPNSVVDIRKEGWVELAGNFAKQKKDGKHLKKYDKWKENSPFKDVGTSTKEGCAEAIENLRAKRHADAVRLQEEYVKKHGEIFKLSPVLQADILNLETAAALFPEKAENLNALKEGIQFLLGVKKEISATASRALVTAAQGKFEPLNESKRALNEAYKNDETLLLPLWDNVPGKSFEQAKAQLVDNINPRTNDEVRQLTYALRKDQKLEPNQLINERLKENIEIYPEYADLLSKQLERIQKHLKSIAEGNQEVEQTKIPPKG